MNIEPIIFFDMVVTIFILSGALIAVIFYFSRTIKHLHSGANASDEEFKKNADLLLQTREKAIRMIDEANNKALDIINKVTLSSGVSSEAFSQEISKISSLQVKEFEKTTSDFTSLYSKILQDLKTKNIEVFQNVSKDIEVNTTKEIKNFKESMQKITVLSQEAVRQKIDSDYQNSKTEIANYKNKELQKIDQEIYALLEKISKLVLGEALSLSEHEDLIKKSLEKAKKEGVFK